MATRIDKLIEQNIKLKELLKKACNSYENQSNWDKKPYDEWYYEAKKLVDNS